MCRRNYMCVMKIIIVEHHNTTLTPYKACLGLPPSVPGIQVLSIPSNYLTNIPGIPLPSPVAILEYISGGSNSLSFRLLPVPLVSSVTDVGVAVVSIDRHEKEEGYHE